MKNKHIGPFLLAAHLHTRFAGPDHDIKFFRIVCSILCENFFPFKIMSSSNGNVSETFEQTENFNSSEDWG